MYSVFPISTANTIVHFTFISCLCSKIGSLPPVIQAYYLFFTLFFKKIKLYHITCLIKNPLIVLPTEASRNQCSFFMSETDLHVKFTVTFLTFPFPLCLSYSSHNSFPIFWACQTIPVSKPLQLTDLSEIFSRSAHAWILNTVPVSVQMLEPLRVPSWQTLN